MYFNTNLVSTLNRAGAGTQRYPFQPHQPVRMSAGRLTHFLELVGRVISPPAVAVMIGFYGPYG